MAKTHTPVLWLEGIKEHIENGKTVIYQAGDKIEGTSIPESEIQRYISLGLCRTYKTDQKNGGIIDAPQPQLSEEDLKAIAEEAANNRATVAAQMGQLAAAPGVTPTAPKGDEPKGDEPKGDEPKLGPDGKPLPVLGPDGKPLEPLT